MEPPEGDAASAHRLLLVLTGLRSRSLFEVSRDAGTANAITVGLHSANWI